MSILATITRATEGRVTWNGSDVASNPDELRAVLGFLPQDFGVYPNLNAVEFLEYLAAVKGLDAATSRRRIDELLNLVNLADVRKRPLGGYSGGMKQRVGIAQALLNDPQLLIVDEPTAGLDPEERVRFRNLLSDLSGERIVILSTHIVSDVEATATDIALIAQGTLVAHASPEELLRRVEGKVWEWVLPSAEVNTAKQKYLISNTSRRSDGVHARVLADAPPAGAQPSHAEPGGRLPLLSCSSSRRGCGYEDRSRMKPARVLYHMVRADFLERVRRYSFLLTLAFAAYLAWGSASGLIILRLGEYRGVFNSAWVGEHDDPGRHLVYLARGLLHREERNSARRADARRQNFSQYSDEPGLLHAGKNPEQLRGPGANDRGAGSNRTLHPVLPRRRYALSTGHAAGALPLGWDSRHGHYRGSCRLI